MKEQAGGRGSRPLQEQKEAVYPSMASSLVRVSTLFVSQDAVRATNPMSDYVTLQNTNLLFLMVCVVGSSFISKWISHDELLSFSLSDYSIQKDTIVKSAHFT